MGTQAGSSMEPLPGKLPEGAEPHQVEQDRFILTQQLTGRVDA